MESWDEVGGFLLREAEHDLRETGEVRPCLAALRGDRGLLMAWSRPFPKGRYHEPLVELLALAVPLGADRLALSLGGRAWSVADPIPPVTDEGDLRQRVVVIQRVDGHRRRATLESRIHPVDVTPDGVRWGAPLDPGPGEGWVAGALHVAIAKRNELCVGSIEALRAQADRCAALGHLLAFSDETAERLGVANAR